VVAVAPWHALGLHLAESRHRSALTQQAVARHLSISQPAYSQIERGLIRPRPALLIHLAICFSVKLAQLCTLAGYTPEAVVRSIDWGQATRHAPSGLLPLCAR
jgi:transcriptional regulator with XRE-family HTH domain